MNMGNRECMCRNSILKRCVSLALALIFMLLLLNGLSVRGSSFDQYISKVQCDFESCKPGNNYTNKVDNTNITQIHTASRVRPVGSNQSIEGDVSLQINHCDIRWNNIFVEDSSFRVSFKIKLDASFDQTIKVKLSTQDSLTNLDSDAGVLLSIFKDNAGNIVVQGSDMTVLSKLQFDEIYSFDLAIQRGSDLIEYYINGKEVSVKCPFVSSIYFIDGLCFLTESDDSSKAGHWFLDGINISVMPRRYQQLYSSQAKGNPIDLRVPNSVDQNKLQVFVNNKQIAISDYYLSSNVIYISAEQFFDCISVPYVYDTDKKILSLETDRVKARCSVPGDHVTVNGRQIGLTNPVRTIDGVLMISPNFVNEVFNAKVWWDYDANILVFTTGEYKTNNRLCKLSSKLYMNGEPYYAIGYNALDLFQGVLTRYLNPQNTTVESWTSEADALLSELSKQNVRAIRVLCRTDLLPDLTYDDVSVGKYLEAMDALLDLCDRYNIQVVLCLDLLSPNFLEKVYVPRYGWATSDESVLDLVSTQSSKSWSVMASFIEKFVGRYQTRNTILMYEIANQGNVYADTGHFNSRATYSLTQLAQYYKRCADLIRKHDRNKLIGSGDTIILPYQWSLYLHTMSGGANRQMSGNQFAMLDEESEVVSALLLLHESLDVISMQNPDAFVLDTNQYYLGDSGIQNPYFSYSFYAKVSRQFSKPLYNGAAKDDRMNGLSLQSAVLSGLQLSFWNDLSAEQMMVNNQKLIEDNLINSSLEENTNVVWEDSNVDVFDPAGIISIDDARNAGSDWSSMIYFAIIFAIMTLFAGMILFAFRNKKVV